MRILLSLAALLSVALFAASASARCMSQNMSYWPPPNTEIDTQPVILIEGMGGHESTVKELKGASLVTPGHHVALTKIATHAGAFLVTQTAWTPKEPLKPGKTYTLVVQGKTKTWRPTAYVADSSKKVRLTYTVAKTPRPALAWTGAPILGESRAMQYGCGPSIKQDMALPTTRTDGLVEVTIAQGPKARTYWVPLSKDGAVRLGHGMCSGPFQLGGAGEYTATLRLVNAAKVNADTAKTLTFSGVRDAGAGGHK